MDMGMTVVEKILASHADIDFTEPGAIIDVHIDARVARDFGGANVVRHMQDFNLSLEDSAKTFFTFDCNPTGSDQKYATNQHICRQYARENGIKIYDIDRGIGTHVLMEEGLAWPGSTSVSTDSHANILGAIGAFGQGMGDKDIAAAWQSGSTWFKVPPSVKIILEGRPDDHITAKDMALNLLDHFGASSLLGYSVELEGEVLESLSLDQRITISSMATEMGAIILLFPPSREVLRYCESRVMRKILPVLADPDAEYDQIYTLDCTAFKQRISLPGNPHDTAYIPKKKIWIDSAFIGSCTNGRIEDMRKAAEILKGKKVAPGLVLKIVPATDRVWLQCLEEGLIGIFKDSGALVSNAGCAGCAAGQVGQNGPGEISISTGNRNFAGKQGRGDVYLASPAVVAASALSGYITDPLHLPDKPESRPQQKIRPKKEITGIKADLKADIKERTEEIQGRVWFVPEDNIDTDMIFHNRYLSITNVDDMGQYTFDNLPGYEDFSRRVKPGDIVFTGSNFGSGSSRQQAVDCFLSLGVQCIVAESFGSIYERNAINAAFPIIASKEIAALKLEDGDEVYLNFRTGVIRNNTRGTSVKGPPFSEVQMEIYQNNGLF